MQLVVRATQAHAEHEGQCSQRTVPTLPHAPCIPSHPIPFHHYHATVAGVNVCVVVVAQFCPFCNHHFGENNNRYGTWQGVGALDPRPVGAAGEGKRARRLRKSTAALASTSTPPRGGSRRTLPGVVLLGYLLDHQVGGTSRRQGFFSDFHASSVSGRSSFGVNFPPSKPPPET